MKKNKNKLPDWETRTDGDADRPYTVNWRDEDDGVRQKSFALEDDAAEWGNENLGERR